MNYKEFVTKIFASNEIKKINENEFIFILPTKYRFAENRTRIKVLIKDSLISLNDMGNTMQYLKSYYSDVEKYQNAINYICKIEDIKFKENIFEKNFYQTNEFERNFFDFIHALHLIANIKTVDKANDDNY